jgi:glycosyltransferase involved in cell wall biosynthesis
MHVVIVDGDVSYPPSSGKRLRTLNLMLRLARHHRLTYIARIQGDPAQAREAAAYLGDHAIEPILVPDPLPHKKGARFYTRLACNLFSPLPYSAASHRSRLLAQVVRAFAARHAVDLWQVEWTPYVSTLPPQSAPPQRGGDRRGGRRLLVAHNVDSLIWQRYHENEPHPLKRVYIRGQWRKFERLERRVFAEVDRIVAVSREDAELLQRRFAVERVDVVDNGIDRPYYEGVRCGGESGVILFLGSLDWRPNLDAVRQLLDHIFPAVRQAEPSARLWIVGRNAPKWLARRVATTPAVELHADVADVRPYLAASGVLAVPLRIGGGSRLKILEALACGLPVVSTRIGAEGLDLRHGREMVLVESIEGMAAALLACIWNPPSARAMAEKGRQLVLQHYDWDVLAGRLEQVWQKCIAGEGRQQREGEACVSST